LAGLATDSYASAEDFLARFDGTKISCLIVDLHLAGMGAFALQSRLIAEGKRPAVIFLTGRADVALAAQAVRAGTVELLQESCRRETLIERIQQAIAVNHVHHQKNALRLDVERRVSNLTIRERDVMRLLALGMTPKEIAARLHISKKTVDNHRSKVLNKMYVANPTQLVRVLAIMDHTSQLSQHDGSDAFASCPSLGGCHSESEIIAAQIKRDG
jgi:FixJ family two-component response regulator